MLSKSGNPTEWQAKSTKASDEVASNKSRSEEEGSLGGPRFCPALYIQRYGFVRNILEQHAAKSVVDFGCAECKILTLMKTVKSLEKITLVDIDERLLNSHQYCIRPALDDFLNRRDNPLHIQLLAGSAAILDQRIVGVEAVSLVEIVEHLLPDVLDEVVENIFGNIHPSLIIVTTPNSDYNVLFPDFSGIRHWDHKFEWSRRDFETWCANICDKYGYKVEVTGIGDPPLASQHLGYCSQAAIFTSALDLKQIDQTNVAPLNYKLISECHYPYKEKKLSLQEELGNEVSYYVRCRCLQALNDQDDNYITISMEAIFNIKKVENLCDREIVREYLKKEFNISKDGESIEINIDNYLACSSASEDDIEESTLECERRTDLKDDTFQEEEWD